MPSSLSAALDRLSKETELISTAAWANDQPSGPFTSAYLNPSVFNLVRDAEESECQPFRRLLDDAYASLTSSGGGPSKPSGSSTTTRPPTQPKTPAAQRKSTQPEFLLTPLRELPKVRGTPQELGATLDVLKDVIDSLHDSYSLKRARNEARVLAYKHREQQERIAELERLIEDARRRPEPESVPEPEPEPQRDTPKLSVDEAIAAEEEALKALEAQLAPLRRQHALRNAAARSPSSPKSPTTPTSRTRLSSTTPTKTPAKTPPRTRQHALPVITNSLVQGPSQGTPPRASLTPRQPSALRASTNEPRSIFGPARKTMTPARLGPLAAFGTPGFGATPRAPRFAPTPRGPPLARVSTSEVASTPVKARDPSPTPTPVALAHPAPAPEPVPLREPSPEPVPASEAARSPSPAPPAGTRKVEGVEVDHPAIPGAIDQIWTSLANLMRTGTADAVERTPEATLSHLASLSKRDPDSSLTPAITTDTILLSHMVLILLRAVRTGQDIGDTFVPLPDIKSDLRAVARARGWDEPDDMANKIIYHAVGLKVARIDRRGKGGPKVRFMGM